MSRGTISVARKEGAINGNFKGENMKDIFYSFNPINNSAQRVVSQTGCLKDVFIDREGIISIVKRLHKRRSKLKEVLGIKNTSQLKNRKYYRKHPRQGYNTNNKELFQELLENGLRIKEMNDILADTKRNEGDK